MSAKKEKWIELISEFLTQQMNHWMLFCIAMTVTGALNELYPIRKPDVLMWACCSIIPLLMFFVRWKVSRFIPFTLCNMAIFAITFFIPVTVFSGRIVAVACGVGYIIHTYILRLKANDMYSETILPTVGVGISVFGILFLNNVYEHHGWEAYFVFPLIGCFAAYMLIYYVNHYLSFLRLNENSTGAMPASEIFHTGMGMVVGYTAFAVMVLLFATNLPWLEAILDFLKKLVIGTIRFIVSLFSGSKGDAAPLQQQVQDEKPMQEEIGLWGGESALFWEIMEVVAIIALAVAFVFLLWKLIVGIIRFFRERFGESFAQKKYVEIDGGYTDIREKCGLAKDDTKKGERSLFGFLSPTQRIRKLYKKKLLDYSVQLVKGEKEKLALFTARESESLVGSEGMADIYEKVRYSTADITAEDVKRMKEVCK